MTIIWMKVGVRQGTDIVCRVVDNDKIWVVVLRIQDIVDR